MNLLQRAWERWNEFWFVSSSSASLGLLRIFYGACVICKMTGLWGLERNEFPTIHIPRRRTSPISELGDLYRDPVPGFDWIPAIGPEAWDTCENFALLAAILWTVGLATRPASLAVLAYFAVPMLHSRFDYYHHQSNFAFFMALMVWLPMGDHYSLDRFLFRSKGPDPERTIFPVRMLQVLLTWVYISTLMGKMNIGWFDGTVMSVMEQDGMLKGPSRDFVVNTIGAHALSIFTLFAQGFFAIVVWTRFRHWGMLLGVLLHLGIDRVMNVTTFSFQMMSLYICFIAPEPRLTRVYFDSNSDEQLTSIQYGRLLNWFDRIEWIDVTEREAPALIKKAIGSYDRPILERADGTLALGWTALAETLRLLPLTFIPSFPLGIVTQLRDRIASGGPPRRVSVRASSSERVKGYA